MKLRDELSAIGMALALAQPASAVRFADPPLSQMSLDGNAIYFLQPDGTGTVLDLATGRVLERGAEARGMPLTPVSCGREMVCPLAQGVLALVSEGGLTHLELRSANQARQADYASAIGAPPPMRVWEAPGKLLLETGTSGAFAIECIDLASLKLAWTYVYPSALTALGSPFRVIKVEAARTTLQAMGGRAEGRYSSRVNLDPNPFEAARVWQLFVGSWILLAVLGVATMAQMLWPRARRPWLAVLLTALTGLLVILAWTLHPILLLATGVWFLIVWLSARGFIEEGTAARRVLGFVFNLALIFGVVLPLIGAFLFATMR